MSKKKKSGNKNAPASYVNLVTAIIQLVTALALLFERLNR